MRSTPMFVEPMAFYNYWGVDLNVLLKVKDNLSNKANLFLMMVEDRMMSWIDAHTFRNIAWEELEGERLENFQKAILTQAMYIFRNSDITMDSGYDPEKGIIAPREQLEKIEISRAALDFLTVAGLYNHKIQNRIRIISSLY